MLRLMRSALKTMLLIMPWVPLGCRGEAEPGGAASQGVGTSFSGPAYITECRQAGVPVPDWVLTSEWTNHGRVEQPFIANDSRLEAELWSYTSTSPAGICLALPRWITRGSGVGTSELFGVICMGKNTSKACFFDNPNGFGFLRGGPQSISMFVGGADLDKNGQGICTNCHAGENPFVIHPEKKAFVDLRSDPVRMDLLRPANGWYEPIAPFGWVMNPGPSQQLAGITTPTGESCVSCHKLPEVSTALDSYCDEVLETAVSRTWWNFGLDETMPLAGFTPPGVPYQAYRDRYRSHFDALLRFCKRAPAPSEESSFSSKDDPGVISPPTIQEPLYACAQGVAVGNIIPGATVELTLNGQAAGVAQSTGETVVAFALPQALKTNDLLEARQSWGGATSDLSLAAKAIDYPDPTLPQPEIVPGIIHECANSVGVRTVPGARVELTVNGGPPEVRYFTQAVDAMYPTASPFKQGDKFQVRAFLCSTPSDYSDVVQASAPPASLRAPSFVPAVPYEGQEVAYLDGLDYGAYASMTHANSGQGLGDTNAFPDGMGSTLFLPASPLARPLTVGDTLEAEPHLYCGGIPANRSSATARPCSDLPAPRIQTPTAGARAVVVERAERGARVRVLDGQGIEIADGPGPLLPLIPPRTLQRGERLTVVQRLGTCEGRRAYLTLVEAPTE